MKRKDKCAAKRKKTTQSQHELNRLAHLCAGLEPIEFLGLCHMLSVKTDFPYEEGEKPVPREFDDIFNDVITQFFKLPQTRKKEIFTLLRDVINCPEED